MIRYEDDCVGCPPERCSPGCPYKCVLYMYCDCCGENVEILYKYDGQQLCKDCYVESVLEDAETINSDSAIDEIMKEDEYEWM